MKHRWIAGGLLHIALLATATHAQELPNAKAVYEATCAACHATGVAGAPRTGDAAAWEARFDKGINALYASAIKGTGAMPPKGGNPSLTDAQVMAAVNYITGLSAKTGAAASSGRKGAKPVEAAKTGAPAAAESAKGGAPVAAEPAKGAATICARAWADPPVRPRAGPADRTEHRSPRADVRGAPGGMRRAPQQACARACASCDRRHPLR